MSRILLLFDIDGTLLRTEGAGMRAMAATAARLYGPSFKWDGIVASGHLDPLLFAEAMALNQIDHEPHHHDTFRDHYLLELAAELRHERCRAHALPGIHELVGDLRRRAAEQADVLLGLLTGNYAAAVPLKLGVINIDPSWFPVTAFGDEAPTRADMVALAMRKYEKLTGHPAHGQRVVVIGDTPRDIACAHAQGCVAFAVATGGYTVDQLAAAGADVTAADLGDPAPLLRLVDQLLREG